MIAEPIKKTKHRYGVATAYGKNFNRPPGQIEEKTGYRSAIGNASEKQESIVLISLQTSGLFNSKSFFFRWFTKTGMFILLSIATLFLFIFDREAKFLDEY